MLKSASTDLPKRAATTCLNHMAKCGLATGDAGLPVLCHPVVRSCSMEHCRPSSLRWRLRSSKVGQSLAPSSIVALRPLHQTASLVNLISGRELCGARGWHRSAKLRHARRDLRGDSRDGQLGTLAALGYVRVDSEHIQHWKSMPEPCDPG
eukprot:scaffold7146_cov115-Isochrysis_galbana.AAC.11